MEVEDVTPGSSMLLGTAKVALEQMTKLGNSIRNFQNYPGSILTVCLSPEL